VKRGTCALSPVPAQKQARNSADIKDNTRINLLGNRLVLIAPKGSKLGNVTIGPEFNLAQLAGDGRIVMGDVRAVPVGK
jgi:molybdate transport system substrate-binding protein